MKFWIIFLIIFQCCDGFLVSEPTQNASLSAIYVELKSELDNLTQGIIELQEAYYNLTQENGELQVEINNLTVNYDRARHDLEDATNNNIKLRNDYEAVAGRYNKVSSDFGNMTGVYDIMKQQYTWLNCEYNAFNDEYKALAHNMGTSQAGNHSNQVVSNNNVSLTCPPEELVKLGFALSWPDRGDYSTQGLLPFTNTFYNEENAIDVNQGKFVCKVPGLYFFATTLLRQVGQNTAASCYLKLNDKPVAYMEAYSDRPQWGDPLSSGMTVIHLVQGDEVYIGDCMNVYQIAGYSNFMGFLISADFITNI